MTDAFLEKTFPIHYFELDYHAELRLGSLLDYLQDIAGEDAVRRGFGVEQLQPRGLTWMLSRYRISLDQPFTHADRLVLRTWPSAHQGLSACREFEILRNGAQVGAASSAWLLIDLNTRRPVRPAEKLGKVTLYDRQAFAEPLRGLKVGNEFDVHCRFQVRRSDLDLNRHVNNRIFCDWALEAVPTEHFDRYRLQQIEINYLQEALEGDLVDSACSWVAEGECLTCSHRIGRNTGELARLKSWWVKR